MWTYRVCMLNLCICLDVHKDMYILYTNMHIGMEGELHKNNSGHPIGHSYRVTPISKTYIHFTYTCTYVYIYKYTQTHVHICKFLYMCIDSYMVYIWFIYGAYILYDIIACVYPYLLTCTNVFNLLKIGTAVSVKLWDCSAQHVG